MITDERIPDPPKSFTLVTSQLQKIIPASSLTGPDLRVFDKHSDFGWYQPMRASGVWLLGITYAIRDTTLNRILETIPADGCYHKFIDSVAPIRISAKCSTGEQELLLVYDDNNGDFFFVLFGSYNGEYIQIDFDSMDLDDLKQLQIKIAKLIEYSYMDVRCEIPTPLLGYSWTFDRVYSTGVGKCKVFHAHTRGYRLEWHSFNNPSLDMVNIHHRGICIGRCSRDRFETAELVEILELDRSIPECTQHEVTLHE